MEEEDKKEEIIAETVDETMKDEGDFIYDDEIDKVIKSREKMITRRQIEEIEDILRKIIKISNHCYNNIDEFNPMRDSIKQLPELAEYIINVLDKVNK